MNPNYKIDKLIQLKDFTHKKDSSFKDLNEDENQEHLIKTSIKEENDNIEEKIDNEEDINYYESK